jgi:hypothetical protein
MPSAASPSLPAAPVLAQHFRGKKKNFYLLYLFSLVRHAPVVSAPKRTG